MQVLIVFWLVVAIYSVAYKTVCHTYFFYWNAKLLTNNYRFDHHCDQFRRLLVRARTAYGHWVDG